MENDLQGTIEIPSEQSRWLYHLKGHLRELRRVISAFRSKVGVELAIDMGTSKTRIYMKGKGIIVDEPSLLAISAVDGKPVEAGDKVKFLEGRSPDYLDLRRPMERGSISNSDIAGAMLKLLIDKGLNNNMPKWRRSTLTFPTCLTSLEKRALTHAANLSGSSRVLLAPSVVAASIGNGPGMDSNRAHMVILLGAGVSEVGIMALGRLIYSGATRTGGETLDHNICEYLMHAHVLQITMEMSEKIKKEIACAEIPANDKKILVTGREAGRGGMKKLEIGSVEISRAVEQPLNSIIDIIQEAIDNCSPAVISDLEHTPILLTGGLSLLKGFPELISKMTGFKTRVVPNPVYSVLKGCSAMINDPKRYSDHLASS